jgi:hypothetical protein
MSHINFGVTPSLQCHPLYQAVDRNRKDEPTTTLSAAAQLLRFHQGIGSL